MADVEKININSTDYDIADAKALRNKDTAGSNSFIDTKAGTTQYPTTEAHVKSVIIGPETYVISTTYRTGITILGDGAYTGASYATVIGHMAHANGSQTVSVGYNANAGANQAIAIGNGATASATSGIAVGPSSNASQNYTTALGSSASATNSYATAIGAQTSATAQYSTTIGSGAATYTTGSTYAVAVGYGARAASSAVALGGANTQATGTVSVALGAFAKATANYAAQIGEGTNSSYGTLQFRNWQLVKGDGKIPEERLPNGIKSATPQFPNLYDMAEEKVSETAILYTGATNDGYTNSQFYRGRVRYGYPHFGCGWVDDGWLDSQNDVMIDQQKFFTKLAEVTKQRIDNNDVENGLIGGSNAEQTIYLYYDADNDYYFIRFDSDSFEKVFNGAPDDITGLSFEDFADYGIYFRNFHKPSDLEGEYEICDIDYYAPAYIDNYDWNNSPSYVNYFKFLNGLADSDWGIGRVIPNYDTWGFEVDGTTYNCPVIPKTYEYDGSEYDGVEVRWEWDSSGEGSWVQYINGEDINRSWSTEDLYDIFGIYVEPGEESNVEYIGLTVRGGDQRYWDQFDPVDTSHFCTAAEKTSMQGDINRLRNTSFQLVENATDLNTRTTSGAYHIQALGCTNLPSTASASRDMFLFVTRTDANNVKQVLITDYVRKSYDNQNYGTYCSNIYVRTLSGGDWRSWEAILTPTDLMFLPGFDKTKKQVIGHNADDANIIWIDAE